MPKALREVSSGNHRLNPLAGTSDNGCAKNLAFRKIQIADLIIQERPQTAVAASNDGHVLTNTQEILDDDSEASSSSPGKPEYVNELDKAFLFRVSLLTAGPPRITRILRVPIHLSFHQLHGILQEAFEWKNCHAYRFDIHDAGEKLIDGERLDMPYPFNDSGSSGSERRKLLDVFGKARDPKTAIYTYDFGDKWPHKIDYIGPADRLLAYSMGIEKEGGKEEVFCLAGEGAPCIEDCGGPGGWENLKKLFKDPDMADPERRRQWSRRKTLDPYKWDMKKVNRSLKKLFLSKYDINAARGWR